MTSDTITITLNSPELVKAVLRLAEVLGGGGGTFSLPAAAPATEPKEAAALVAAAPTAAPAASAETSDARMPTFAEVHATLKRLKEQKGAAVVKKILNQYGCTNVQDLAEGRFLDVVLTAQDEFEC